MRSQNGWPARPDLPLRPLVVAGESFAPGILDDDDVYTVLRYVAEQMHERVEPVVRSDWHQADDWGFYYRANANDPNNLSNHASGTAIDYNATRHPNGVPTAGTFTAEQRGEIRTILSELGGVVRWGGDYTRTPDAMHFEINADKAAVAKVAARLRARGDDEMSWDQQLSLWDPENNKPGDQRRAGQQLGQARGFAERAFAHARAANRRTARIEKSNTAILSALAALTDLPVDVRAAVEDALREAVVEVDINVSTRDIEEGEA